MRLLARCHRCGGPLPFSTPAADRAELSRIHGSHIDLTCRKCGHKDLYSVNELQAVENKLLRILALILFLGGTPLLWFLILKYAGSSRNIYFYAGLIALSGIPLAVFSILLKEQGKKIRRFNRFQIRDTDPGKQVHP